MKNGFVLGLALLLAAATPVSVVQEAPVAVVMKVAGDVRIAQAGAAPEAAAVGAQLQDGDRVIPASGATAVVVYRTGQKQEIRGETTISAPSSADRGDMFQRTVGVLAQAANSNARTSPNRQGMIRPIPGEPVKVAPRLGVRVASTRPTFVWRAFDGAEGYTLQIRKAGSPPVRFQSADTVFTLPADADALIPGATYHWTIAPNNTRRPAREDSLVVLGREAATELEQNLEAIAGLGFDPEDDGQLLKAVVYTDMGLYYQAAEMLSRIERSGELSADVLMLKGEVLDRLGLVDEARLAFDAADERTR